MEHIFMNLQITLESGFHTAFLYDIFQYSDTIITLYNHDSGKYLPIIKDIESYLNQVKYVDPLLHAFYKKNAFMTLVHELPAFTIASWETGNPILTMTQTAQYNYPEIGDYYIFNNEPAWVATASSHEVKCIKKFSPIRGNNFLNILETKNLDLISHNLEAHLKWNNFFLKHNTPYKVKLINMTFQKHNFNFMDIKNLHDLYKAKMVPSLMDQMRRELLENTPKLFKMIKK